MNLCVEISNQLFPLKRVAGWVPNRGVGAYSRGCLLGFSMSRVGAYSRGLLIRGGA